jgi:hypothetical protein
MNMGQKEYKRKQGLTIQQQNAIDLLVTGKTDQAVADAVGVTRPTVTCWRLYDPHFEAALNQRRKEVWGASADRIRALLPKAFDTLEKAIDEGSYQAALALIKLAGLEGVASEIGPDDAEKIMKKKKQDERLEELLRL